MVMVRLGVADMEQNGGPTFPAVGVALWAGECRSCHGIRSSEGKIRGPSDSC